jgi:hypothetical protein
MDARLLKSVVGAGTFVLDLTARSGRDLVGVMVSESDFHLSGATLDEARWHQDPMRSERLARQPAEYQTGRLLTDLLAGQAAQRVSVWRWAPSSTRAG